MKSCINPQCKRDLPDGAAHCPYCGQSQAHKRPSGLPFYAIGGIMLFFAFLLVLREIGTQNTSSGDTLDPPGMSPLNSLIATASRTPNPTRTRIPSTPTRTRPTATPASPTITPIYTSTSCPGAPPTRIQINDLVRVVTTNRDRLVLRSLPEINDSSEIQRLNFGTQLKIFDGPVCVQDPATFVNYWFWEVRVKSTRAMGWVAEGDRTLYFVETVR